jgi:hypothetical protein
VHPLAVAGVEPYASRLKAKPDEMVQLFLPEDIKIVVTEAKHRAHSRCSAGVIPVAALERSTRKIRQW